MNYAALWHEATQRYCYCLEPGRFLFRLQTAKDGAFESPATVSSVCRRARKEMPDLGEFHFHLLRHTFTTNLLTNGSAPKDVQELLGHSDVGTTMNIYAHANRETKRSSTRMLDQVVS